MTDYIIVGAGLAGVAFAEAAIRNHKSVFVFDNDSLHSSRTAAGVYNPVILKRFSRLADAQQQLDLMQDFYLGLKSEKGIDCNTPMPILRRFASVEEQNDWFAASDKEGLKAFLSTDLVNKAYDGIDSPFGFGQVLQTGYVDTAKLLDSYRAILGQKGLLSCETFNHAQLVSENGHIKYKDIEARHIIFAEGFGIKSNPFFNFLPLEGTKGEVLTIKSNVALDVIIKGGVFVLPLADGLFKVGATYNWDDKTENTTTEARAELVEKLLEIFKADFEIVDQKAGIRPTVKDRKPLIGTHPRYPNIHLLNGLGTRGIMLGPSMAGLLFESIEYGNEIPESVHLKRFCRT